MGREEQDWFFATAECTFVGVDFTRVMWMGGGSGAGKTTVSRALALRFDLGWYRVDAHAYEHQKRLGSVVRGSQDERWVKPSPDELAERFVTASRQLFPLVLEDLEALDPDVGVIAEGPQLFPSLVAPYLASPDHGLWLLPTEDFQRRSLSERVMVGGDAERALENRLARNKLLDDRTRSEAAALGLTVIDVDGRQDIEAMVLDLLPVDRLPRARIGSLRSRMRRAENEAMVANVRSFRADLGPDAPPEWPVPFLCECEGLGCTDLVELTPTEAAGLSSVRFEEFRDAGE